VQKKSLTCVIHPEEGRWCPASRFNCRVPVSLDRSALCEDAHDAENAEDDLQDTAEIHYPAERSVGLDVVEQPCPVVEYLPCYRQTNAANID
jgi:hypothetical protein